MKKIEVSLLFLLFISMTLRSQNLIGASEKEIRQYMTDNEKSMTFQNFINNSTFKYLKYTNDDETQTLLFFLNEQSICKSERLVCDKSLKAEKIKEFNSKYKKAGENKWTETKNNIVYKIELKEEEWSFNVTITLNE